MWLYSSASNANPPDAPNFIINSPAEQVAPTLPEAIDGGFFWSGPWSNHLSDCRPLRQTVPLGTLPKGKIQPLQSP